MPQGAVPTIIFDLDGTLADTAPDLVGALNHAIATAGLDPVDRHVIGHLAGHGSLAMIRRAFEVQDRELDEPLLETLQRRFLAHYDQNLARETVLYDGAAALISELKESGYLLAVCTNKPEGLARKLVRLLGIASRFSYVAGGDTFTFRKPDGRHLAETVLRAGGDPVAAVMIGDTITDLSAARQAGMPVALVDFGYSDIPVAELGPDAVLSGFGQATSIIRGLL